MKHRLFSTRAGFTIVELLVVIVVIGVLTSIVTVAGTYYIKKSADTTVQSNLQSAVARFRSAKARDGTYPTTQTELDNLVTPNSDVTLTLLTADATTFCLKGKSSKYSDIIYYMSQDDTGPTTTACASTPPTLAVSPTTLSIANNGGTGQFSLSVTDGQTPFSYNITGTDINQDSSTSWDWYYVVTFNLTTTSSSTATVDVTNSCYITPDGNLPIQISVTDGNGQTYTVDATVSAPAPPSSHPPCA